MSDGERPEVEGRAFDAIDPKLTVFALANGMDLTKQGGYRRLEWFTDGLERGIVIETGPGGVYSVAVSAWPYGGEEATHRATVAEGIEASGIVDVLGSAIEKANGL